MPTRSAPEKPIRVRVKRVAIDPQQRYLVVLGTAKRELPIRIGIYEGQAITLKLQRKTLPRPMTHDLFVNALSDVGWEIEKLVITDLRETTLIVSKLLYIPLPRRVRKSIVVARTNSIRPLSVDVWGPWW